MTNILILKTALVKIIVSTRYNNIHSLAIKLNKIVNHMSPKIMSEVFKLRDNAFYNLQHTSVFCRSNL